MCGQFKTRVEVKAEARIEAKAEGEFKFKAKVSQGLSRIQSQTQIRI